MRERRPIITVLSILLSVILLCFGCGKHTESELTSITMEDTKENEESSEDTEDIENDSIWVYVCGAVCEPGVYTFEGTTHICEVIERAGGMTDLAAQTFLNQAELVNDGQQIYVPTQEEVDAKQSVHTQMDGTDMSDVSDSEDGRVNINKASKEELMTLSGIGEAKADSIISYREEQGTFQTIEEIMQIEGIKEGVFQKIKDKIKV